mmetsp:Transcript_88173/g.128924  ORF Transcript_88173/g.128924 Transcript_88173/m.128924 type:complete len:93 (+) Transcript_88173:22-300(+)
MARLTDDVIWMLWVETMKLAAHRCREGIHRQLIALAVVASVPADCTNCKFRVHFFLFRYYLFATSDLRLTEHQVNTAVSKAKALTTHEDLAD